MKAKNIVLVISFIYSLCNCREPQVQHDLDNQLHFNVSDWQTHQEIPKEIIEEIQFVPLSTSKENLIGGINKIIFYKDNYYIMDGSYRKDILVFDRTGRFLKKIGEFGQGVGEILRLGDFNIDFKNDYLVILDSQIHKLLFYNLSDGKYIKDYKLDFWASNFIIENEDSFLFYSKDQNSKKKYSFARINLNNNITEWFLEKDEYDTSLSGVFSLFQSENNYFTSYFKDVVYQIHPSEIKVFATFDFGNFKVPKDKLINAFQERKPIKLLTENYTLNICNFLENKHFIIFNLELKGISTFVIYSKDTHKYLHGINIASPYKNMLPLKFIAANQDEFITAVDAGTYNKLAKDLENDTDLEINHPVSGISNQSNPVIVICKFKKF